MCALAVSFMIGSSNSFSIRQDARSICESVALDRFISIPSGVPVTVDGKVSPKEWDDAESIEISADLDWKIPVRFKHDEKNLYFQFTRARNGKNRLFPELFFDSTNKKSHDWEKGNWWFHVSANLRESDGEPNVYEKNGVFQCAHKKQGWEANNPPETDTIEIRIALDKIGIETVSGARISFAAGVTNATGDEKQTWHIWPAKSRVESPSTWGVAILKYFGYRAGGEREKEVTAPNNAETYLQRLA